MQEKQIQLNGKIVRYLEGGTGRPLVLLHGLYVSSDIFLPHAKILEDKFHLIAPDLPGFGGSEALLGKHTLDNYSHFLYEFLKAINIESAGIYGISYTGALALRFGEKYPFMVNTIAIQGGIYYHKNLHITNFYKTLRLIYHFLPFSKFLYKHLMTKPPVIKMIEAVSASRRRQFQEVGEDLVIKDFSKIDTRAFDEICEEIFNINIEDDLYKLTMPVLIIVGDKDDTLKTADARTLHGLLPRGKLVIIPGGYHELSIDQPETVANLLADFFK